VTDQARIAFAVAVAENGVIGAGGDLPWRLPTDLKRFRKTTMGKPIVMGRKTYVSIGKPLDGRDNIVITRDRSFSAPGVHVAFTIDEGVALGRKLAVQRGADEVVVIGGAEIFRATLASADRIYLTLVRARPEGDTFLDPFDPAVWAEAAREPMPQAAGDQYPADFILLDRKR
jgi:dihydrofolate reductase